ncbi:fasciclin-1 isoform X2 [Anthonomus grandis grandis]|uniref:fasciclin-1 isoform X2 n=1 Tax=Anthonomus grandis grandis TaxID=2921223 RepID=UPI0021656D20|nr:fasciclin-1 isoform X2 [Anthonomus grandis grandis]
MSFFTGMYDGNMRLLCVLFAVCCNLSWHGVGAQQEDLDDVMKKDMDINQFYAYLEVCNVCNFTLEFEPLTIFAPLNAAFQNLKNYNITDTDSLVQYHLTNVPIKLEQLGVSYTSINTRLPGSLPIWITLTKNAFNNAFYVNNAKIYTEGSNVVRTKHPTKAGPVITQILHKIDGVLIPTRPSSASSLTFNPNAWDFLANYDESFVMGNHRLRIFTEKIKQYRKEDIFRTDGGHTFFIPVDDGFMHNNKALLDDYIIDAHVIPREVLFTTPAKKDFPFQTLANRDNSIRVVTSFTQELRGNTIIDYVKSHTLYGDDKHPQGVVLAKIVEANIPVKNGVIHLIHKPLVVVDSTVMQILSEHMDYICNVGNIQCMENIWKVPPTPTFNHLRPNTYIYDNRIPLNEDKDVGVLNNFFNEINSLGPEGNSLVKAIEKSQELTLFVPCNTALESYVVNNMKKDKLKFLEVLKMHVVLDQKLFVESAKEKNNMQVYQVPTMAKGRNLYFNVLSNRTNTTMIVEGGGVTATVIQPDLAAKNGIIHVINRVLGIPYANVLEKLQTDPMLSASYKMGQYHDFNKLLNETNTLKKFTYFVPSNKAWEDARLMMPSTIKKLFMEEFAYFGATTLQQHLVVSDQVYTMERIKQMQHEIKMNQSNRFPDGKEPEVPLPALRGSLKISVEEKLDNSYKRNYGSAYIIQWRDLKVRVHRPNVECTNGIIHVIDFPFLQDGDIRVSGSFSVQPTVLSIFGFFLVKFILH